MGPERGLGGGANFGPQRTDFLPEWADFGLERANLGPERGLGGGRTYVRTDVRNGSPLCPTGHRPFGAAAQKGKKMRKTTEKANR